MAPFLIAGSVDAFYGTMRLGNFVSVTTVSASIKPKSFKEICKERREEMEARSFKKCVGVAMSRLRKVK
jgi:hypothetical protein